MNSLIFTFFLLLNMGVSGYCTHVGSYGFAVYTGLTSICITILYAGVCIKERL